MGRRRRSRRRKNQKVTPGDKVEVIAGQQLFVAATNAALVTVPVRPSSFTRVLAIADSFSLYRCTKLEIEVLPSVENESAGAQSFGSLAFGYSPGPAPNSPPSTEAGVMALPYANFYSNGSTVPRKLMIPRRELVSNGIIKWYKTIVGTEDDGFETQGNIFLWATINTSFTIGINFLVRYTFELQGWILASNTPLYVVPKDVSLLAEHTKMLVAEAARRKAVASASINADDLVELAGVKYLRITSK